LVCVVTASESAGNSSHEATSASLSRRMAGVEATRQPSGKSTFASSPPKLAHSRAGEST
jgi:hypothetical protein